MEKVLDIRPIKKEMRAQARNMRRSLSPEVKNALDRKIKNKLLNLFAVREATTVLCYVSTEIEVDTRDFISTLLEQGKRVAVPRCEGDDGEMNFYYINSLSELSSGSFGVDEPNPSQSVMFADAVDSVCIVPAFMFDTKGFRIGYGKGYYDRFLSRFEGSAIGVCYSDNLQQELHHGKYDRAVSLVVTDKEILTISE